MTGCYSNARAPDSRVEAARRFAQIVVVGARSRRTIR
jgi:hypothetical protein